MSRTMVIVLSETTASELTFDEKLHFTGNDWQNQPIFIYKK